MTERLDAIVAALTAAGVNPQHITTKPLWAPAITVRSGRRVAEIVPAPATRQVSIYTWTDPGDGTYPLDMRHREMQQLAAIARRVKEWTS